MGKVGENVETKRRKEIHHTHHKARGMKQTYMDLIWHRFEGFGLLVEIITTVVHSREIIHSRVVTYEVQEPVVAWPLREIALGWS